MINRGKNHKGNMFKSIDIEEGEEMIENKLKKTALNNSDEIFRTIFYESPFGISITDSLTGKIYEANQRFQEYFSIKLEENSKIDWMRFTHPDDIQENLDNLERMNKGETNGFTIDKRYIRSDGSIVWAKMTIVPIIIGETKTNRHLCIIDDITDKKILKKTLDTSEEMYKTLYDKSPFGIALIDSFTGEIYEANQRYLELISIKLGENSKIDWMSFTHPDDIQEDLDNMELMNKGENNGFTMDKRYIRPDGSIVWVRMTIVPIIIGGTKINRHLCIIDDITHKRELFEEVEYASEHDSLTGLYNRRFFNDEFNRQLKNKIYPISLIIGDVNGLKMFNDSFGHIEGDKEIIRIGNRINEYFKGKGLCARVGGDEFAVIINGYSEDMLNLLTENLEDYINSSDQFTAGKSLTVSFGYSIQRDINDSLDDLVKEAETFMYNKKYYNSKSGSSQSISIIMGTLFEKSEREKEHSERVGDICEKIAFNMNFSEDMVNKVKVAGYFHDIGKIAIDESLLNKKGKLTNVEWEMIKSHPIKSARILASSNEYKGISEIVLSHHERYDGSGYPNGLKGNEIPVEARIIAIADAFDAMTKERAYKNIMTNEQAVIEISRCSGTQFDPDIVSVFIKYINSASS